MRIFGFSKRLKSRIPRVMTMAMVIGGMAFTSGISIAQDFTLFEPVDASQTPEQQVNRPQRGGDPQRSGDPEFVLVGTTRVGDQLSVMLTHRSGQSVVVRTALNQTAVIEGYEPYSVTNVGQGRVVLNYPAGSPCVDAVDRGVRCNGNANSGELSLVNLAPLESRNQQAQQEIVLQDETVDVTDPNGVEAPINPFAVFRNRGQIQEEVQNSGDNPASPGGFVPRRIDPASVPPGMRIISTPFGDRLVEQ